MTPIEKLNRRFQSEFPKEEKLDLGLRLRRSLSWFERSLREKNDPDVRFILCWIAFNSAYGIDVFGKKKTDDETEKQKKFLAKIVELDKRNEVHYALWDKHSNLVQSLLDNEYVYHDYWKYEMSEDKAENWREDFEQSENDVWQNFRNNETLEILTTLFDRLYVLRNQIIHGGATWCGSVNRDQVLDGADLLSNVVPLFLEIMMSGRDVDWGKPSYPPMP